MCIKRNGKLSGAELQELRFTSVSIYETDSDELFSIMVLHNEGWVELDHPVDRCTAEALECKLWRCVQSSDKLRFDVNSALQHYLTKVDVLVGEESYLITKRVVAHSVEAAKRLALLYQAERDVGIGSYWDGNTLYDHYGEIAMTIKDIQPVSSQADLNVLIAYGF